MSKIVKNIFALTAATVILILFLEAGIRLSWAICLEMKYGYHTRQTQNDYFLFNAGEITDTFGETLLKWKAEEDLFNAVTHKPPYGPSLSELFPELPWRPEKQALADSLNQIILNQDKQIKFLQAFSNKYQWQSPLAAENIVFGHLSENEARRTVRVMMEEMYPVYKKFYFVFGGASRNPLEVLSYGSNAVIKVRKDDSKKRPADSHAESGDVIHLYAVGGSTTRCMGVSNTQCWTTHLETMLQDWRHQVKELPQFKVINLGISSGTSIDSKNAILAEKQKLQGKLDLDYLLWYEGLNDVFYYMEGARHQKELLSKPRTLTEMRRLAEPMFGKKFVVYLYQHSALVFWVFHAKSQLVIVKDAEKIRNTTALPAAAEPVNELLVDEAAKENYKNLTEIRPLVQKQTFMFSIPLPRESAERSYHLNFDAKQKMFKKLEGMAKKENIPFGDVAADLETQPVENIFTTDRVHLNAYGNFLLAQKIFAFIKPYIENDLKK